MFCLISSSLSAYSSLTFEKCKRSHNSKHGFDIKQLYPDGKEVYLYAENHTVATTFPNRLKVCKFANGQIEKNFQDGTKNVNYADGTVRNV